MKYTFIFILTIYAFIATFCIRDLYKYLNLKFFFISAVFLLINFALFLDIARDLHLGWDALTLWKLKANNFYLGRNFFDFIEVPFPQYPHLGTYIWAFFWKNSFLDIEYYGRLYSVYLYVLSLFAVSFCFENKNYLINFFIVILLVIFSYNGFIKGYQDIYIFSLITFFGFFIYQKIKLNIDINNYVLLIPVILPWIKNEGAFYAIFLIIVYAILQKNLLKRYFFSFIIISLIIFQFYLSLFYHNLNSLFQFEINISNLLYKDQNFFSLFEKLWKILFYSLHGFFKHPILLVDLLIISAAIYFSSINKENFPFFIFLVLNIFFILSIYLLTPSDLKWHLQTSVDRLMLQTSGIYIYLFALLKDRKYIHI